MSKDVKIYFCSSVNLGRRNLPALREMQRHKRTTGTALNCCHTRSGAESKSGKEFILQLADYSCIIQPVPTKGRLETSAEWRKTPSEKRPAFRYAKL